MSGHRETRLSGRVCYQGRIIRVEEDRVQLENGAETRREVIRHNGAVAVLAAEDGHVLMVRQFRYPLGRELLELPAGKLEPGEPPEEAAARELLEETGAAGEKLVHLGRYYGSPGVLDEKLELYFTAVTRRETPNPDEGEFLTAERVPLARLEAMIARGEVEDGKTLAAFALAKARGLV